MTFPLFVDIEKGQMVALGHLKVFSSRIAFGFSILRSKENSWYAEHADYSQYFLRTLKPLTNNQEF